MISLLQCLAWLILLASIWAYHHWIWDNGRWFPEPWPTLRWFNDGHAQWHSLGHSLVSYIIVDTINHPLIGLTSIVTLVTLKELILDGHLKRIVSKTQIRPDWEDLAFDSLTWLAGAAIWWIGTIEA